MQIRGKKIFITGGAGFIGSRLIERLIGENEIVVYDNLARNALKDLPCYQHPNLKIIRGDILDYEHLKGSIPLETDIVIHIAAIVGVSAAIQSLVKTIEVNMVGTYNLLKALEELNLIKNIERLVYFSTGEIFGINTWIVDKKTFTELHPMSEARWTYCVSKLAGEHLTYIYHKQYGLRTVILRPFNVYGPGQVGGGAIHQFVVRAIKNEPLLIHGDGDQIRAWLYIDDMVDGILLSLQEKKAIGEAFNIGNPRATITILSLAEKIIYLAGSRSKIIHVPKPYVDVELRIPDIEKAKNLLGFEPKIDLNEGLRRTIEWYRERMGKNETAQD